MKYAILPGNESYLENKLNWHFQYFESLPSTTVNDNFTRIIMSPFYPYPLLNACCRTILTIVSCCLLLNCMNYIVPTTAQNIPSESDGSTSQDSFRSILLAPDGKAPSPPPETMMMTAQQQQELQSEQTMSTPVSIIDESDGKVCDFHGIEITKECPSDYSGFDWEAYASELYQARAMIFSGNIDGAREYTLRLLQHITGKFSFAFECPMAAIATYYTMATILMFQGAQRRALSMLQMGFIFVRDRVHYRIVFLSLIFNFMSSIEI